MQRTPNGPNRPQNNTANSEITAHKSNAAARAQQHDQVGTFWDMLAIRVVFTAICVAAGFHFRPFSVSREAGALTGFLFALAVILFEVRLRRASMRRPASRTTNSSAGGFSSRHELVSCEQGCLEKWEELSDEEICNHRWNFIHRGDDLGVWLVEFGRRGG